MANRTSLVLVLKFIFWKPANLPNPLRINSIHRTSFTNQARLQSGRKIALLNDALGVLANSQSRIPAGDMGLWHASPDLNRIECYFTPVLGFPFPVSDHNQLQPICCGTTR